MASLCDFTDSDGFVTSVPSTPGGGITQDDISTLITYQSRGDPVPGCASSGGGGGGGASGGGGGGGGSTGSPDITASVTDVREDFPDKGDARVEVTFTNNGTARGSVPIQVVNPSDDQTATVKLDPGESTTGRQRVRNAGGQTVELGYIVDGRRVTATVSPTAQQPDESRLRERLMDLRTPAAGEVVVNWSVTNEVTSGSGRQKSGTVAIDLDGQTQERQSVTVSPGGLRSGSVRLADVTPGTREVCVRLQ